MELEQFWREQAEYNLAVQQLQKRSSAEWMQVYILGLMSECGSLLEAMRWKQHRLETKEDFGSNVPEELADLTKYVVSMWILMGFSPEEALQLCMEKSAYMGYLLKMEKFLLGDKVVVFDLDDVLCATRKALSAEFLNSQEDTLHLDIDNRLDFEAYRRFKNNFELSGGYVNIDPLYDIPKLFTTLYHSGVDIVVYTARPVETFKRIKRDTIRWFEAQGTLPMKLLFGREERVLYCSKLRQEGKKVVLVEDDPTLAQRAMNTNISTIVPERFYNRKVATLRDSSLEALLEAIYGRLA